MQHTQHTIAAIATPAGTGGIGIIKISGTDAVPIAASLFRKRGECESLKTHSFQSHRLYYGHITDPENGRVIDEVLFAPMFAPHSYTREDVVEIHSHSGMAVLNAILNLLLKKGARLAEPGEFTKRAFLNGRIDLTQAEAVIDIINAKTDKSLEIAASQIKGDLKNRVESVSDALLDILTRAEAAIDFPDDVEDIMDRDAAAEQIKQQVIDELERLISQYETAHVLRDGLKVVIAGRPNAGKSSLMNCLLQKDRAIVTPIPGTTRDLIEETLNIRGIPVVIADTAGLHDSDDPVEVLGIRKTYEYVQLSDLILFMIDLSRPVTENDHQIYEKICHKNVILVANKSDLVEDEFTPDIPDMWKKIPLVRISALYDQGLDALRDRIASVFTGGYDREDTVIPNLRHKLALERGLEAANTAVRAVQENIPFELVSIDIRESLDSLGEITGLTASEDILDQIFSRFCIGK
jgi:tRNA modification GTPase